MQLYTGCLRPPVLLCADMLDYFPFTLTNYYVPAAPGLRFYLLRDGSQVLTALFSIGFVPTPNHFPYGFRVEPDVH